MTVPGLAATYWRWVWARAVFHRGWWLLASVYLVVSAELSASELVLYGATMSAVMLVAEVPTGVVADTISRKWSLVIAHLVMGSGMAMLGLVTAFPLILVTQVLWGLGWTFSSGAEVAWVTDELDQPERVGAVLLAGARWELVGAASGLVAFGGLGWAIGLGPAIVMAGVGMMVLGGGVAVLFPERRFEPARERRWQASLAILRGGLALARGDRTLLVIFGAWFLVNGGAQAFGQLSNKQLLALGFPREPDPVLWFALLGLTTLATGALVLRAVESRVTGAAGGGPRWVYAGACVTGSLGVALLALAPGEAMAITGVLLAAGVAWPVTRVVSVIWVNERTTSDVRATVHSLLSQVEVLGEVTVGLSLGMLARTADISLILVCASGLVVLAGALVLRAPSSGPLADATKR